MRLREPDISREESEVVDPSAALDQRKTRRQQGYPPATPVPRLPDTPSDPSRNVTEQSDRFGCQLALPDVMTIAHEWIHR
jgi:hypothetical protein